MPSVTHNGRKCTPRVTWLILRFAKNYGTSSRRFGHPFTGSRASKDDNAAQRKNRVDPRKLSCRGLEETSRVLPTGCLFRLCLCALSTVANCGSLNGSENPLARATDNSIIMPLATTMGAKLFCPHFNKGTNEEIKTTSQLSIRNRSLFWELDSSL